MVDKYKNTVADTLLTMGYDLDKASKTDSWNIYVLGSAFGNYSELYPNTKDDNAMMKNNLAQKRFVVQPNTLKVGKQPHYWHQYDYLPNNPVEVKQHTLWYNRVMTDVYGSGNTQIMESLTEHYDALHDFVDTVDKPKSFNRRKEINVNTPLLPFFLGKYSPEITSYALRNNYHPGDMLILYAESTGGVDERDLDIISGLPEEIILALIQS